jgi:YHS domain-containing protein
VKWILFLLMLSVSGILMIGSCSKEKSERQQTEVTNDTSNAMYISADMLTYSQDVMCGMDLHNHTIADTAIYEGQLYGFCSDYCKSKFKEDPKAALAKYENEKEK